MHFKSFFVLFFLAFATYLHSDKAPERLILLSDVDGVIRECVDDTELDTEMVAAIEKLLETKKVEIAFISGSPCASAPIAHPWQEDTTPLGGVFYPPFKKWMAQGLVTIHGAQGGQTLTSTGACEFDTDFFFGDAEREAMIYTLLQAYCEGSHQPFPKKDWVSIGEELYAKDKGFRLVDRGCEMEIHAALEGWNLEQAKAYFTANIKNGTIVSGISKRAEGEFYFLKVSLISKDMCAKKYLQSRGIREQDPKVLIVAFGDTQTDVGLYQVAREYGGQAYHFGQEGLYEGNPKIVRTQDGHDHTHTQGTLTILRQLFDHMEQK
jgi:hypothetical protein